MLLWLFFGDCMGNFSKIKRSDAIGLTVWLVLVLALGFWLTRPILCVQSDQETVAQVETYDGLPMKIRFIHSVQKTPVEEYLHIESDLQTIQLDSTVYHSFGVGLPFLETDGDWRQEGDDFILENMNRHFPTLSLRAGVGTKLTLTVDGKEYPLYDMLKVGDRIDIYVVPRYATLRKLF